MMSLMSSWCHGLASLTQIYQLYWSNNVCVVVNCVYYLQSYKWPKWAHMTSSWCHGLASINISLYYTMSIKGDTQCNIHIRSRDCVAITRHFLFSSKLVHCANNCHIMLISWCIDHPKNQCSCNNHHTNSTQIASHVNNMMCFSQIWNTKKN